jgi:hypothetical protein
VPGIDARKKATQALVSVFITALMRRRAIVGNAVFAAAARASGDL